MTDEATFVPFPDGIKFHTQEFGHQLDVGAFLVEPCPAVNLLVDVGSQDFGQIQFLDDRVEALGLGVSGVGNAVNDEEMDVIGTAQAVEILDFLAHPFRACRIGRADDNQVP